MHDAYTYTLHLLLAKNWYFLYKNGGNIKKEWLVRITLKFLLKSLFISKVVFIKLLRQFSTLRTRTPIIASPFKCDISYLWRAAPSLCICRASCFTFSDRVLQDRHVTLSVIMCRGRYTPGGFYFEPPCTGKCCAFNTIKHCDKLAQTTRAVLLQCLAWASHVKRNKINVHCSV